MFGFTVVALILFDSASMRFQSSLVVFLFGCRVCSATDLQRSCGLLRGGLSVLSLVQRKFCTLAFGGSCARCRLLTRPLFCAFRTSSASASPASAAVSTMLARPDMYQLQKRQHHFPWPTIVDCQRLRTRKCLNLASVLKFIRQRALKLEPKWLVVVCCVLCCGCVLCVLCVLCVSGVCVWCVCLVCVSGVCVWCVSGVCVWCVCVWCLVCVCVFCVWCVCVWCFPGLSLNCATKAQQRDGVVEQ